MMAAPELVKRIRARHGEITIKYIKMKYILSILLLISGSAFAQPATFKTVVQLPLSDTTIESVSYNRKLVFHRLDYTTYGESVSVRCYIRTYRNTTHFFEGTSNQRLSGNVEIVADNSSMVDSMGNLVIMYSDYETLYRNSDTTYMVGDSTVTHKRDTTTESEWITGTPRYWREYEWYQFVSSFQPVIIHQAILQAMYRWAARNYFIN